LVYLEVLTVVGASKYLPCANFRELSLPELWPSQKTIGTFIVLMRKLSKRSGIHWNGLLWVLKQEYGYHAQIPHLHFLAAALSPKALIASHCRFLHDNWMKVGGGIPRIELYIPALRGRSYVLKKTKEKSGGDRGISDSLADNGGLMLSKSVIAYLKRGF
jgi:hypothetical protein